MTHASDDTGADRKSDLDLLLGALPGEESAAIRSWLSGGDPSQAPDAGALRGNHEPLVELARRPGPDEPRAIRSVGVIGGGTAGYLTALALRSKRPWLDVSLVESPTIPIIGVGEATVPGIVAFLHHYLQIAPDDFYRKVLPTWKLGIFFDWGPHPDGFMAPFDWSANPVGLVGALDATGNIDGYTLQSMLMRADRVPVFDLGDRQVSLMKHLPFAYHLDNARLVAYLSELARERGVRHVAAQIDDVVLGDDEWIESVHTTDGRELRYDLYVDCTGFRSLLLEKTLKTPFISYASSLFTDTAVTGNRSHGGHLKPYTSAVTMASGWCWDIPTPEDDHLGYVYSSAAISDEAAAEELARRFPGVSEPRTVRFRVGRHERAWRGNVMAIGNSYAFVEPLESTGLLMITEGVLALLATLPASWSEPSARELVNQVLGQRWDALRWFLSLHYRFNTRLDTPFWKEVTTATDVSGAQPLLDLYATGAPMRFRNPLFTAYLQSSAPIFYGIGGLDNILLGQQVPTRLLRTTEPADRWQARRAAAQALVRRALPQHEGLAVYHSTPRFLRELLHDNDSWASRRRAQASGLA